MKFRKLDRSAVTRSRNSAMALAAKTEIQTKINGAWVHDANDSDKPMI